MALTADAVVQRVARTLNDADHTRWKLEELLGWLNEALQALAKRKPTSYVKTEAAPTVAGAMQTLPAGGVALVEIQHNIDDTGAPSGAIVPVDRKLLDIEDPAWTSATAADDAVNYVYDGAAPHVYFLYPPRPAAAPRDVMLSYAASPPPVTLAAQLPVDDVWEPALVDFILYRAFNKEAEYAGPEGRAAEHYAAFRQATG